MKTYAARSTNGRWGFDVIDCPIAVDYRQPFAVLPGKRLHRRGAADNVDVWTLLDDPDVVAVIGGDVEIVCGPADVAGDYDLQSHMRATLLNCRYGTVVKLYGYKRRTSASYRLWPDGAKQLTPAEVLDVQQEYAAREKGK